MTLSIIQQLTDISKNALIDKDKELRTMANMALTDIKKGVEDTRLKNKLDTKTNITEEEELQPLNSLINKLGKGTKDSKGNTIIADDMKLYIEFLKQFQPTQLTEEEIKDILITESLTSMKDAIPFFNKNYQNRFNPSLVNQVIKGMN